MRGLAVDGDATPGCNLHVFAYDPTANIVVLASRGVGQDLDDAVCMGCKENGMQHRRDEAILVLVSQQQGRMLVSGSSTHMPFFFKSLGSASASGSSVSMSMMAMLMRTTSKPPSLLLSVDIHRRMRLSSQESPRETTTSTGLPRAGTRASSQNLPSLSRRAPGTAFAWLPHPLIADGNT